MTFQSLSERYAKLQAERESSWEPDQLARNAQQRRELVQRHDPAAHPRPGDEIGPFVLIDQDGNALSRDSLTANGPAVLIFFRFGGCPTCNLALRYYNETLWPQLREAGIPLVAVSAQTPVDRGIIDRHQLGFPVTADPGYALARALGITFFPLEQPPVKAGDDWIGATLGTDSYEIDQPTVLILNQNGTVRSLEISPDWLDRTESDAILARLPEAASSAAA